MLQNIRVLATGFFKGRGSVVFQMLVFVVNLVSMNYTLFLLEINTQLSHIIRSFVLFFFLSLYKLCPEKKKKRKIIWCVLYLCFSMQLFFFFLKQLYI